MKLSEYTMPELRRFLAECNFTQDETRIFLLLSEGCTNEYTAEISNYSVSTVKRLKNQIKAKIDRLENL